MGEPESAWLSGIRASGRDESRTMRDGWKPPETARSALGLARKLARGAEAVRARSLPSERAAGCLYLLIVTLANDLVLREAV